MPQNATNASQQGSGLALPIRLTQGRSLTLLRDARQVWRWHIVGVGRQGPYCHPTTRVVAAMILRTLRAQ